MPTFPFTKPSGAECFAYSLTKDFAQIYSMFHQEVSYHFIMERVYCNWILHTNGTNFKRQMFAYKFLAFITIGINLLNLLKLMYDTSEIY